jgi:DNA-binding response OmpR family regulator
MLYTFLHFMKHIFKTFASSIIQVIPMAEPLMDERSRPMVLVIEDNPVFLGNAVAALRDYEVIPVMDLEQAVRALRTMDIGIVLSDVHFPRSQGKAPEANVGAILEEAYRRGVPVCFVTRADHHGLLELGDEGYISLKALALGDMAATMMEVSRSAGELDDKQLFRKMKASGSKSVRAGEKSLAIWTQALDMARNAATKPNPLGGVIRQIRRTLAGADVSFENGAPRIVPLKKR